MNQKEKAKELVDKFSPYMYCFIGSSMLTNTEEPSVILNHAKACSVIAVKEIIAAIETTTGHCELRHLDLSEVKSDIQYWENVIEEIEKIQVEFHPQGNTGK